ncbi:S-methyl thiohydantoin desulfurase domain-containing protein [Algoriphagus sediminis]|uniref:DUF917 family protein n=1 Tax=Algoriphagus sediminis TaxID=3057113 RepID=A0ABT7YCN0_9BACT|nr:DUF917 family protein [Algoriphagus sediminis]MDN3204256.1 DUF917 family protein [Algoriphagus sediminis]
MKKIGFTELEQIILGTAFLGSGGGGMTKTGYDFLSKLKSEKPDLSISLVTKDDNLDQNSLGMVICDIGAVSAIESRQDIAISAAFESLATYQKNYTQVETLAVLPVELGPESTMVPFVLAAANPKVVVLDGDGARRAVPQIELTTWANGDLSVSPAVITNDQNKSVTLICDSSAKLDEMLRPIISIPDFGNSASLAMFSNPISKLIQTMIPGTISLSIAMGKVIQSLQKLSIPDQGSLAEVNKLKAQLIGKGKVLNTLDNVGGGFDHGKIVIADSEKAGLFYTILNQNENLIVFSTQDTSPLAIAPDLICVITREFRVITNGEISSADELFIIRVQAPEVMKSERIIKGFQSIINKMGYAGSMDVKATDLIGLGDLLHDLLKKIKSNVY